MTRTYRKCPFRGCRSSLENPKDACFRFRSGRNAPFLHRDGGFCVAKVRKESRWVRKAKSKRERLRNRVLARRGLEPEFEYRTQGWLTW